MCLLIQIIKVDTGWVLFFAFLLSMDTGSKRTCQILSIVFPSVKLKNFQLHNWGEGSDGFESVVFITGPSMLLFLRKLIYLNSGQLMEFIACSTMCYRINKQCPVGHLQFAALKHCLESEHPSAILPMSYGWWPDALAAQGMFAVLSQEGEEGWGGVTCMWNALRSFLPDQLSDANIATSSAYLCLLGF